MSSFYISSHRGLSSSPNSSRVSSVRRQSGKSVFEPLVLYPAAVNEHPQADNLLSPEQTAGLKGAANDTYFT